MFLLQLDINVDNNDDDEQDEGNNSDDLHDVFDDLGDDGVEEAIREAEEEVEVKAAAHAAELADQAYMVEALQIPSLTSAQESVMESTSKMAGLKRVYSIQNILFVFTFKCSLAQNKLKMFQIVYKCDCVFF